MTTLSMARERRRQALTQAGVQAGQGLTRDWDNDGDAERRAQAAKILMFPTLPKTKSTTVRRIVVKRSPDPWQNATLIEDYNIQEEARDFMPVAA